MNVVISETARGNMRAIRAYYVDTSPAYAKRIIESICRRFEQIARFPQSGAVVEEYSVPQIRQVIESRYRIIYRIKSSEVEILAIRHASQSWPRH